MNAALRLLLGTSAAYLGAQVARIEPGLAFPLGILAAVWVALWWSDARYNERLAMEETAESEALTDKFGPDLAAIATESHHDRWEDQ